MNTHAKHTVYAGAMLGLLICLTGCVEQIIDPGPNEAQQARLLNQAYNYQDEGLYESALVAFELVLEDNPSQLDAHIGVASIYEVRGDYEKAAEGYAEARRIDPANYTATYKLGLMYQLLNRVREAINTYLAALALNPESFEANLNLATAYLQSGEPQLALTYAERAVELNDTSQPARVNLGSTYAALGQYQLAIDEYRTAAELGDLAPEISLNLADAFLRTGNYARAKNTLEALLRDNPGSVIAIERLGYTHFKMGEFQRSLLLYEQALAIDPNDTASLNGVGVNYMTLYLRGKREDLSLREKAIETWQRSVQVNPRQQRIVDLIARYRNL